jgi:diguanylate cyclase (GGDEF)-like protein/PAS domain S-box-containing protein
MANPSESDSRYRALVERIPLVTYTAAPDKVSSTVYVSPQIEKLLGFSPEDYLADTELFAKQIHPEDRERVLEEIHRSHSSGQPFRSEYRMLRRDGRVVWVHDEAYELHDEDGKPLGLQGITQDITERKQAEKALQESEQRFGSAFRDAAIGIALVGQDGRFLQVNRSLCRIVGYSEEELLEKTFQEITHPDDLQADVEQVRRMLAGEIKTYHIEKRYFHKNGHVVWILLSVSLVHDQEGEPLYFISQIQDITERKRAEEALKESEEKFRITFEDAPIGVAFIDLDGRRFKANRALCEMLGCSEEDLLGENYLEHVHPDDREMSTEHFHGTLEEGAGSYELERRYIRVDGHVVWNLTSVSLIRDSKGNPSYFVCLHQDITERKEAEKRLKYQATHDLLTDLPNRHLLMDRLKRALRLTRRRRDRKVAVLYLDLDNFKAVNDSLGHEAGDLLLVAVGERVRWCLRPEDTLARFGGDEFAVLLEEVETPSDTAKVAERIVERFRAPLVVDGRELFIKPSIGIALGTARENTAEDVLRDADTAMYQAKGQDDDYRVFDPAMYEQALRRLKLEGDLRRAIENEEFVVCYQPIVNLQTGETSGVEALVRWQDPEQQGLLAPSQFISVAEESGLVVPMGRWVLEEACRQGAKWQQEQSHVSPLVMAVNLSAKQLQHPDMAETVEEILKKTGYDAYCLSLDITETVYIEVLEGSTAALDKLKRLGVDISVDDFGTGYSSLAYLKRVPAETLKIDKSFIKGIGEAIEDTAIVRMIIELAHTLGMEVTAEGVESEEQADQLKEMGCDRGRGFYFAEPLSPEEATRFLSR